MSSHKAVLEVSGHYGIQALSNCRVKDLYVIHTLKLNTVKRKKTGEQN